MSKLYDFVCNFWDMEGRNKLHPKIARFGVSVLAVVTNKVETAIAATSQTRSPARV